ncbi:hypothetical protein ASD11_12375 [Aeromicrobium sp. Root495]|nr:hypothetical protein ASD11_12375 [Aeromicrobium sp. Root495]
MEVGGAPDGPLAVLVHGYPDQRRVWDLVAADLGADHRLVTYDVRGAGGSTAPSSRAGYRLASLVDDLVAVLDHVAPDGEPVHLVGHDWGSIQLWDAVLHESDDERLRGRIASFTSISGPALEQLGRFLRDTSSRQRLPTLGRQLLRSWYVGIFQVPVVPELVLAVLAGPVRRVLETTQRIDPSHWGESFGRDARRGVNLYRANRVRFGRPVTRVAVQLVVPTKDAFVGPALLAGIEQLAPDLRRVDVVADHWVVRTQPDVVAEAVRSFVADVGARLSAREA